MFGRKVRKGEKWALEAVSNRWSPASLSKKDVGCQVSFFEEELCLKKYIDSGNSDWGKESGSRNDHSSLSRENCSKQSGGMCERWHGFCGTTSRLFEQFKVALRKSTI